MEELSEATKLFYTLSDNKFTNTKTLRTLIGNKSAKTLERRLELIKNDFKSFDLVYKKNVGYQLVPTIVNLQPKKLKEKKVLFEDEQQESLANTIAKIATAIERKRWVTISNYKKVSSEEGKEYKVLPLKMYSGNEPYIIAVNFKDKSIKRFNLKRGKDYILLHDESVSNTVYKKYQEDFKKLKYDDFGWLVKENTPLRTVSLKLNYYSMNMIDHDFPELAKKRTLIKKRKKQSEVDKQDEFEYALEVNYCSIKAIGRLVTGMLNHIKVEGSKEVKDEFREFVKMTVIESLDKSIS